MKLAFLTTPFFYVFTVSLSSLCLISFFCWWCLLLIFASPPSIDRLLLSLSTMHIHTQQQHHLAHISFLRNTILRSWVLCGLAKSRRRRSTLILYFFPSPLFVLFPSFFSFPACFIGYSIKDSRVRLFLLLLSLFFFFVIQTSVLSKGGVCHSVFFFLIYIYIYFSYSSNGAAEDVFAPLYVH